MSTHTGKKAESKAESWLTAHGHKIIARNWRSRSAEIDLVSVYRGTIYFVEVKYRQSLRQGSGLDYITPSKLRQMSFAAEQFRFRYRYDDMAPLLAVIDIAGKDMTSVRFIEVVG